MKQETIAKLKVVEALQDDAYKGIARIDTEVMRELGLKRGDVVSIKGNRETIAIVDRAYPADIGEKIVRIDGIIRRNAKTGIGEVVDVKKVEVKEAKKVTIAPSQKGIMIQGDPESMKRGLLGRAVVKGDIVVLGGVQRRRDLMSEGFEDIFGDFLGEALGNFGFGGIQQIRFLVVSTNPNQPCVITENTEMVLSPKAVEVSEEKVLEVTYEDIGGLTEEVKKIREMVELPLKHPEIFLKLGIEPPKGVLLHGPPGTGKTLLAKAVANESEANFILLNGPEIMCVSGETPILTNPKGYVKAEEIYNQEGKVEKFRNYDVKRLKEPISTYAFKDGKIEKAHITHTTKLVANSYKLKLSDGNEITVSENQPFLVYKNGDLVWEPVKNIKIKDFVARLNKIDMKEESYHVSFEEFQKSFDLAEKDGRYALKSKNLSRSNFIKLPKETSPELLEILGLVVSDGNISDKGDSIGFYNNNIDLIDRFKYLMNRVFGIGSFKEKNEGDCFGVIVYSKLLVEYFRLLGFSYGKKESVPSYFFNLPILEVQAFIRGYFDGDGTVSRLKIKNMIYPTPVLYSINRDFLMQLQSLMLLKLGIQCRIKEHNTPKGLMHKLVVRGNEGRVRFLDIGAISKHKLERLQEIKKVIRIKEHENIPHPSLLIGEIKRLPYKNYRNKDYYVYKTGNATKHSLKVLYNLASENNLLNPAVQKEFDLLNREDISWERVENIGRMGERELYDFTVDKDSFVGAPYFFLHNSKFYGESEKKIRDLFEEAEKTAPAIIFIDEIDAIAPKREESYGEVERRVVSQLLTMMDGLKTRGKVVVIGATNRPNALDPALRRPGRFDREVEINVPDKGGRLSILKIHTRNMPLTKDVNLEELAAITHGFVGADISALAKEAAMAVLRKSLPKFNLKEDEPLSEDVLKELKVTDADFKEALKTVRPSAMREVLVETPNVKWNDVGGMDSVKQELKEAVEWPLKYPESFVRMGIRPPRGILLYGPPGTGKTLLAKAVAKESEANFIQVKGPSLLSMWVGESEKGVRKIFERARQVAPCIIFFDEIDALASRRGVEAGTRVTEQVLNQMLAEMDGLEELQNITVIGATNRPDMLDSAILRPGRFDRLLLVSPPNKEGRLEILKIHTKNMPLMNEKLSNELQEIIKDLPGKLLEKRLSDLSIEFKKNEKEIDLLNKYKPIIYSRIGGNVQTNDEEEKDKKGKKEFDFRKLMNILNEIEIEKQKIFKELADTTEGYVGADIESLCREAAMLALRKDKDANEVTRKHFEEAMKKVKASVSKDAAEKYRKMESEYLKSAKAALDTGPAYAG